MPGDALLDVLKRATATGATEADGYLIEERSFSAQVRLDQVETVAHSHDQRLALRVFVGRASAAASTSDLSRESLERLVDEATSLARVTAADPLAGLPGMSIPVGFGAGHMPVGMQLIGNYLQEAKLLNVAHRFQQATDWHAQKPEGF